MIQELICLNFIFFILKFRFYKLYKIFVKSNSTQNGCFQMSDESPFKVLVLLMFEWKPRANNLDLQTQFLGIIG